MSNPSTGRVVPTAAGTVVPTAAGRDLILQRTFRAPIEDVWASITESDRTARWYGQWKGEPGIGRTIQVQMAFEEGQGWSDMRIDACEPPRHLALYSADDYGVWSLDLELTQRDEITTLRFVHHLDDKAEVENVGPGWEYYLDAMVAAYHDGPRPDFDDYYPAMKAYYEAQDAASTES